jgi:hypothetical protein
MDVDRRKQLVIRIIQAATFGVLCPLSVWLMIAVCEAIGVLKAGAASWMRVDVSLYIIAAFALVTGGLVPIGDRWIGAVTKLAGGMTALYVLVQVAQFIPFAQSPDADIPLYFWNLLLWAAPLCVGSVVAALATWFAVVEARERV